MEALLYEKVEGGKVRCNLCWHRCLVRPGGRGICGVRENQDGTLVSLVYGKAIARHVDSIEKKPLFHFLPGSRSYSIATAGCNFKCRFCQNSEIAQMPGDRNGLILGENLPPERVVKEALAAGCASISYTYTEPTVYFEYARDCARLAVEAGLRNVFVTNGYMTPEAVELVSPWLSAANVDLKAMSAKFYKDLCQAVHENVLTTLKRLREAGVLVEVTTLLIPGWNDGIDELRRLADFLCQTLGPETPWHVSRFHPAYRLLDALPTPAASLVQACRAGKEAGLRYVYMGNVPGLGGEDTFCHNCQELLVQRTGFTVRKNTLVKGACPACGTLAHGIWE
jgi:pyruvate formate lyase activating enzyme